jgi:hypothetical protein
VLTRAAQFDGGRPRGAQGVGPSQSRSLPVSP